MSNQSEGNSNSYVVIDDSDDDHVDDLLLEWVRKFSISHSALRDLLRILNPFIESLPKDHRTLLQTTIYSHTKYVAVLFTIRALKMVSESN